MPDTQPTYNDIAKLGDESLRAWILHLLIDELEDICEYLSDSTDNETADLYEEANNIFCDNALLRLVPDDILLFVLEHLDELIREMPIPTFHLTRDIRLSYKPKNGIIKAKEL